jgi:hypothetical protein
LARRVDSDNWSVWFNEAVIITVLKSVAKKCLLKTKYFSVSCDYSDNWSVWFSETVIITVLKSVTKKCLVKKKYFSVSCDYSNNWSVVQWDCYNYRVKIGYQEVPSEGKRLFCEL